jgi:hypothetical protein
MLVVLMVLLSLSGCTKAYAAAPKTTLSIVHSDLMLAQSRPSAPVYRDVGAASCVAGDATTAPTATLSFTAPTTNVDGTPIAGPLTYNLYQGTTSGGETQAATKLTGSPIAITTGLKVATTYYFEVTAVDANGNESSRSNEVCKTFPAAAPNTVTITIK